MKNTLPTLFATALIGVTTANLSAQTAGLSATPPPAPATEVREVHAIEFDHQAPVAVAVADVFSSDFNYNGNGGQRMQRPTLVTKDKLAATAADEAKEDFSVMHRILEKAVRPENSDHQFELAMGIALSGIHGARSAQTLYLEGYGAVFNLNVGFPLLAPVEKAKETKAEEPEDSDWEDAKRELQGKKNKEVNQFMWHNGGRNPGAAYDGDQVESLKENLIVALKNASRIRQIKSDENITVILTGPQSTETVKTVRTKNKNRNVEEVKARVVAPGMPGMGGGDNSGESTTMTVQVKKSDAEAFAKGKLTEEEFTKKVSIQTY